MWMKTTKALEEDDMCNAKKDATFTTSACQLTLSDEHAEHPIMRSRTTTRTLANKE